MMKKLSVIVPVYNVEKYLDQCLHSILSQPIENLEVICINDGSKDKSLEILEKWQREDKRVQIINKSNTGYGDTMNRGIAAATGDYIGIVESDDVVIDDKLALLLLQAEKTNADVVKGNYYYLYTDEKSCSLYENFKGCTYGKIINAAMEEQLFLTAPAIWSGLYKRQFLHENKIHFLPSPGASYQDTSFAFKVWACAKRVFLIEDPIIYYRQDNMVSSSNNDKKAFEIFNETIEMTSILHKKGLKEFLPVCMRAKFQSYAWTLNRLCPENKLKFLLKVFFDVRVDFYQGNLVRKYWEEENWNIIFNIILNLSGVCKNLLGEYAPGESEQVYSALKKIGEVYIWEEEDQEERLSRILYENDVRIAAQIKVDSNGDLIKIENGEITQLSYADRENLIVLRAGRKDETEIRQKLYDNFMYNYIVIDC